jgi:hypothetical protein
MHIKRTSQYIDSYINIIKDMGLDYTLRHGTYTTKVIHSLGRKTFSSMKLTNKAFVAANKIKKDVLESEFYQQIKDKEYSSVNYGYNKNIRYTFGYGNGVLNIDISQAYAHCLLLNNLITTNTFDYISKLPKSERLIVVGMLARTYTEFSYSQKGDVNKVDFFKEPTYNVFMFLINEIDNVMKDCVFYLGNYYYFYWVDGIFFKADTPKHIIKKVEGIFEYMGYPYKYEDVSYFQYKINEEDDNIYVNLVKNGEPKQYVWGRNIESEKIKTLIYEKFKYGKSVTI